MAPRGRGSVVELMRIVASVIVAVMLTGVAHAQEKLTLATPVARPSVTEYQVEEIRIRRTDWTIRVVLVPNATGAPSVACEWVLTSLRCNNGYAKTPAPAGFANAEAMVKSLNKANLTTVSLEKQVYNKLVADGAFAATVTGTPE